MGISEPRLRKGAPPPLFERFVQKNPTVGSGAAIPSVMDVSKYNIPVSEVVRSVVNEVGWLLNTRHPIHAFQPQFPLSVADYGIPDLSNFTPQSPDQRQELGKTLERAIEAFEPRLKQVHVHVEEAPKQGAGLYARVEAQLVVGSVMQPVAFPVGLRQTLPMEEVYERER